MATTQLILIKNGSQYDISELVSSYKWGGKKGAAPRNVDASMVNNSSFPSCKIDIDDDDYCIFKIDGKEVFRGQPFKEDLSHNKASFKLYDDGIYLANNTDTFSFTNKTATQIFQSVCKKYGLKMGNVDNTGYVIKELIKESKKIWDTLLASLAKTYKHTGRRYYIYSSKGELSLIKRSNNMIDLIVETGSNIKDFKFSKSYESIVTRVVCYNDKHNLVATAKSTDLEKKKGIFQNVIRYEDDKSKAQIQKLCENALKEKNRPKQTLNVTVLGDENLISGRCLRVIIKELGVSRKYYIDSDTHSISSTGVYTTSLSLNAYYEEDWGDDDE